MKGLKNALFRHFLSSLFGKLRHLVTVLHTSMPTAQPTHCVEVRPIGAVMHPLQLCPMSMSMSRRQMAVGKTPALRADFESSGTMTVCKALLLLFSVVSAHHTDVRTQTRDQNHSDGICVIKLDTPHYPRDKVLCSFLVWYRRTSLPHNR